MPSSSNASDRWIVLKFGGTSVSRRHRWDTIGRLAKRRAEENDARILVVGACMQEDRIHPMLGIGRELSIQFALAYDPMEFAAALQAIADGKIDLSPWLTGTVGVEGVPQAFADLADPEHHAKSLVVPTFT